MLLLFLAACAGSAGERPDVPDGAEPADGAAADGGPPDAAAPDALPAGCVASSLAEPADVEGAGFELHGGTFRDGGWAVDATCDRLERRLAGDWNVGRIEFEALDLLRVIPFEAGTHGCERFILNLNPTGEGDPDRTRVAFASMAGDCGAPRGNLRAIVFGGPCCVDTDRLPDASDGQWHHVALDWDGGRIRILVDGEEWASDGLDGVAIGSDIDLQFGSECAEGDQSGAVFRNLVACPGG